MTLKIDTSEPVELGDFVGAFTSIANEFERYVAQAFPGAKADPHIYIREVRSGCIEADMVTGLAMVAAQGVVANMDQIIILEDFVRRWGSRMTALITNSANEDELKSAGELNDFLKAAQSISSDPLASHRLEAATFEDEKRGVRASFSFSASEARAAEMNIDDRKKLIATPSVISKRRVLMRYTRTDVHDAILNKRSGERGVITEFSSEERPIMYASDAAEHEIRDLIREADDNAYKRGFIVDVSAQMNDDKIIAYAVSNFHGTIDLD